MAEFTPITTQEELDALIGDRLKRERENVEKKYGDYESIKDQNSKYATQIEELNKNAKESADKYADLEKRYKANETNSAKMRIAYETGLPKELAGRLSGETEEDIRKDAEILAKLLKPKAPEKDPEPAGKGDSKKAAFREMLNNMKGE